MSKGLPKLNVEKKKWDAFISYASEDRADLALPLAEILRNEGLQVWFDRFELKPGDSISQSIEEGLANSRVGIIVLSPTSLKKNWTKYEVAALKQLYINFSKRIIPIWKDVGPEELRDQAPGLLDIRSLSLKEMSTEEIAYEIISVADPNLFNRLNAKSAWNAFRKTASVTQIPLKDLRPGPRQREKLNSQDLSRARVLHSVFRGVIEDNIETWIDNFCRDFNYEEEILLWEMMAALFLDWISAIGDRNVSAQERKIIFEVVFKLASGLSARDVAQTLMKLPRKHVASFQRVVEKWDFESDIVRSHSANDLVNHPTVARKFENLPRRRGASKDS